MPGGKSFGDVICTDLLFVDIVDVPQLCVATTAGRLRGRRGGGGHGADRPWGKKGTEVASSLFTYPHG
jgi:hypothetical protein